MSEETPERLHDEASQPQPGDFINSWTGAHRVITGLEARLAKQDKSGKFGLWTAIVAALGLMAQMGISAADISPFPTKAAVTAAVAEVRKVDKEEHEAITKKIDNLCKFIRGCKAP